MSSILLAGLPPTLLATATSETFWLPKGNSTFAGDLDGVFYFIYWLCIFFFLLILAMAFWFVGKYKQKGAVPHPQKSAHHSTALELVWSVIPLILVLGIFVMGFRGFLDMRTPPDDAYEIQVTGQKWNWTFTYPNGYEDPELHVPVGEPVRLVMNSIDVLHSFFIPEYRVKQDVVPGRYTDLWFEVLEPGSAPVYCTEYCGTQHSEMLSTVIALPREEFDAWLTQAADWISTMAPAEAGRILWERKGCVQCHSIDGAGGIGPTFKGGFGNRRQLTDGSAVTMDENYIRESILNPRAKMVAGFDPVMPTYQGRMKEDELNALIAFMKELK